MTPRVCAGAQLPSLPILLLDPAKGCLCPRCLTARLASVRTRNADCGSKRVLDAMQAHMSQPYAGRSHDEAIAARKGKRQSAQAPPGGEATITGTEPAPEHGSGELSDEGRPEAA
jgi:hypothetical protein